MENKKIDSEQLKKDASQFAEEAGKLASAAASMVKSATTVSKEAVLNAIDQNGDGQIDVEDVIILGLRVPGVCIDREKFLRKELFKLYPEDIVDRAVATTPAQAGITKESIDHISNEIIKFERNCVSGISTALGMPGGWAMVATIPADIAQYYGYMLRAAQKLMYLYGFPQIELQENSSVFDTETINVLTICLGVMYGVAGANNAIKAMAKALASGVEKKLLRAALTKGTIYPIVKKVANWFTIHMTKEVFAGFFKKAIPVVGGVLGGGITFISFKPCCDKLKASLQDTMLSNPNHTSDESENIIIDASYTEESNNDSSSESE
ncbi:MAG: hypothetical protein IJT78_01180 [Oscillospiraceae bacterium]|nr:hypothetical protein [Oscillospiraceae bacterium]